MRTVYRLGKCSFKGMAALHQAVIQLSKIKLEKAKTHLAESDPSNFEEIFDIEEDLKIDPNLIVVPDLTASDVLEANFIALHPDKGKGPWIFYFGASIHSTETNLSSLSLFLFLSPPKSPPLGLALDVSGKGLLIVSENKLDSVLYVRHARQNLLFMGQIALFRLYTSLSGLQQIS